MKKKKVILSFDYELFFGDNAGTVEKTILNPTHRILETLDKVGGKAVFFVDYLMLKRMHEECEKTHKEAILIEMQLKEIIKRGSRIELHLHPHWVDAKYINGEWDFSNFDHYCLNSLPKDEVTRMFVEGSEYLNRIARDVDSTYKVVAFRAGGWAVLPFSCMKEGFEKAGIIVDSSITMGRKVVGYTHEADFTNSPKDDIYRFENDVMQKDDNGKFVEVQISSYKMTFVEKILDRLYRKKYGTLYRSQTDGTHTQSFRENGGNLIKKRSWLEKIKTEYTGYAIRGGVKPLLMLHTFMSRSNVIVYIGHPKDMCEALLNNIIGISKVAKFIDYKEII